MSYIIREYQTYAGRKPFSEWLDGLDGVTQTRLSSRVRKVERGLLGDYKGIEGGRGLLELREHFGPGYRIYFTIEQDNTVVLLFAGSAKDDQNSVIRQAIANLEEYRKRPH